MNHANNLRLHDSGQEGSENKSIEIRNLFTKIKGLINECSKIEGFAYPLWAPFHLYAVAIGELATMLRINEDYSRNYRKNLGCDQNDSRFSFFIFRFALKLTMYKSHFSNEVINQSFSFLQEHRDFVSMILKQDLHDIPKVILEIQPCIRLFENSYILLERMILTEADKIWDRVVDPVKFLLTSAHEASYMQSGSREGDQFDVKMASFLSGLTQIAGNFFACPDQKKIASTPALCHSLNALEVGGDIGSGQPEPVSQAFQVDVRIVSAEMQLMHASNGGMRRDKNRINVSRSVISSASSSTSKSAAQYSKLFRERGLGHVNVSSLNNDDFVNEEELKDDPDAELDDIFHNSHAFESSDSENDVTTSHDLRAETSSKSRNSKLSSHAFANMRQLRMALIQSAVRERKIYFKEISSSSFIKISKAELISLQSQSGSSNHKKWRHKSEFNLFPNGEIHLADIIGSPLTPGGSIIEVAGRNIKTLPFIKPSGARRTLATMIKYYQAQGLNLEFSLKGLNNLTMLASHELPMLRDSAKIALAQLQKVQILAALLCGIFKPYPSPQPLDSIQKSSTHICTAILNAGQKVAAGANPFDVNFIHGTASSNGNNNNTNSINNSNNMNNNNAEANLPGTTPLNPGTTTVATNANNKGISSANNKNINEFSSNTSSNSSSLTTYPTLAQAHHLLLSNVKSAVTNFTTPFKIHNWKSGSRLKAWNEIFTVLSGSGELDSMFQTQIQQNSKGNGNLLSVSEPPRPLPALQFPQAQNYHMIKMYRSQELMNAIGSLLWSWSSAVCWTNPARLKDISHLSNIVDHFKPILLNLYKNQGLAATQVFLARLVVLKEAISGDTALCGPGLTLEAHKRQEWLYLRELAAYSTHQTNVMDQVLKILFCPHAQERWNLLSMIRAQYANHFISSGGLKGLVEHLNFSASAIAAANKQQSDKETPAVVLNSLNEYQSIDFDQFDSFIKSKMELPLTPNEIKVIFRALCREDASGDRNALKPDPSATISCEDVVGLFCDDSYAEKILCLVCDACIACKLPSTAVSNMRILTTARQANFLLSLSYEEVAMLKNVAHEHYEAKLGGMYSQNRNSQLVNNKRSKSEYCNDLPNDHVSHAMAPSLLQPLPLSEAKQILTQRNQSLQNLDKNDNKLKNQVSPKNKDGGNKQLINNNTDSFKHDKTIEKIDNNLYELNINPDPKESDPKPLRSQQIGTNVYKVVLPNKSKAVHVPPSFFSDSNIKKMDRSQLGKCGTSVEMLYGTKSDGLQEHSAPFRSSLCKKSRDKLCNDVDEDENNIGIDEHSLLPFSRKRNHSFNIGTNSNHEDEEILLRSCVFSTSDDQNKVKSTGKGIKSNFASYHQLEDNTNADSADPSVRLKKNLSSNSKHLVETTNDTFALKDDSASPSNNPNIPSASTIKIRMRLFSPLLPPSGHLVENIIMDIGPKGEIGLKVVESLADEKDFMTVDFDSEGEVKDVKNYAESVMNNNTNNKNKSLTSKHHRLDNPDEIFVNHRPLSVHSKRSDSDVFSNGSGISNPSSPVQNTLHGANTNASNILDTPKNNQRPYNISLLPLPNRTKSPSQLDVLEIPPQPFSGRFSLHSPASSRISSARPPLSANSRTGNNKGNHNSDNAINDNKSNLKDRSKNKKKNTSKSKVKDNKQKNENKDDPYDLFDFGPESAYQSPAGLYHISTTRTSLKTALGDLFPNGLNNKRINFQLASKILSGTKSERVYLKAQPINVSSSGDPLPPPPRQMTKIRQRLALMRSTLESAAESIACRCLEHMEAMAIRKVLLDRRNRAEQDAILMTGKNNDHIMQSTATKANDNNNIKNINANSVESNLSPSKGIATTSASNMQESKNNEISNPSQQVPSKTSSRRNAVTSYTPAAKSPNRHSIFVSEESLMASPIHEVFDAWLVGVTSFMRGARLTSFVEFLGLSVATFANLLLLKNPYWNELSSIALSAIDEEIKAATKKDRTNSNNHFNASQSKNFYPSASSGSGSGNNKMNNTYGDKAAARPMNLSNIKNNATGGTDSLQQAFMQSDANGTGDVGFSNVKKSSTAIMIDDFVKAATTSGHQLNQIECMADLLLDTLASVVAKSSFNETCRRSLRKKPSLNDDDYVDGLQNQGIGRVWSGDSFSIGSSLSDTSSKLDLALWSQIQPEMLSEGLVGIAEGVFDEETKQLHAKKAMKIASLQASKRTTETKNILLSLMMENSEGINNLYSNATSMQYQMAMNTISQLYPQSAVPFMPFDSTSPVIRSLTQKALEDLQKCDSFFKNRLSYLPRKRNMRNDDDELYGEETLRVNVQKSKSGVNSNNSAVEELTSHEMFEYFDCIQYLTRKNLKLPLPSKKIDTKDGYFSNLNQELQGISFSVPFLCLDDLLIGNNDAETLLGMEINQNSIIIPQDNLIYSTLNEDLQEFQHIKNEAFPDASTSLSLIYKRTSNEFVLQKEAALERLIGIIRTDNILSNRLNVCASVHPMQLLFGGISLVYLNSPKQAGPPVKATTANVHFVSEAVERLRNFENSIGSRRPSNLNEKSGFQHSQKMKHTDQDVFFSQMESHAPTEVKASSSIMNIKLSSAPPDSSSNDQLYSLKSLSTNLSLPDLYINKTSHLNTFKQRTAEVPDNCQKASLKKMLRTIGASSTLPTSPVGILRPIHLQRGPKANKNQVIPLRNSRQPVFASADEFNHLSPQNIFKVSTDVFRDQIVIDAPAVAYKVKDDRLNITEISSSHNNSSSQADDNFSCSASSVHTNNFNRARNTNNDNIAHNEVDSTRITMPMQADSTINISRAFSASSQRLPLSRPTTAFARPSAASSVNEDVIVMHSDKNRINEDPINPPNDDYNMDDNSDIHISEIASEKHSRCLTSKPSNIDLNSNHNLQLTSENPGDPVKDIDISQSKGIDGSDNVMRVLFQSPAYSDLPKIIQSVVGENKNSVEFEKHEINNEYNLTEIELLENAHAFSNLRNPKTNLTKSSSVIPVTKRPLVAQTPLSISSNKVIDIDEKDNDDNFENLSDANSFSDELDHEVNSKSALMKSAFSPNLNTFSTFRNDSRAIRTPTTTATVKNKMKGNYFHLNSSFGTPSISQRNINTPHSAYTSKSQFPLPSVSSTPKNLKSSMRFSPLYVDRNNQNSRRPNTSSFIHSTMSNPLSVLQMEDSRINEIGKFSQDDDIQFDLVGHKLNSSQSFRGKLRLSTSQKRINTHSLHEKIFNVKEKNNSF